MTVLVPIALLKDCLAFLAMHRMFNEIGADILIVLNGQIIDRHPFEFVTAESKDLGHLVIDLQ